MLSQQKYQVSHLFVWLDVTFDIPVVATVQKCELRAVGSCLRSRAPRGLVFQVGLQVASEPVAAVGASQLQVQNRWIIVPFLGMKAQLTLPAVQRVN